MKCSWKSNLSSYLSYLLTEAIWGVLSYFNVWIQLPSLFALFYLIISVCYSFHELFLIFLRRTFSWWYEENIYLFHYLTGIITRSHRMGVNRMEILCQCDRSYSVWRPCQPGGHTDRLCRESASWSYTIEGMAVYTQAYNSDTLVGPGVGWWRGLSAMYATYLVFLYVDWLLL